MMMTRRGASVPGVDPISPGTGLAKQDMNRNCRKCGHTWEPRTGKPKSCPACKSYSWEREPTRLTDRRALELEGPVIADKGSVAAHASVVVEKMVPGFYAPKSDMTDEEIEELFK